MISKSSIRKTIAAALSALILIALLAPLPAARADVTPAEDRGATALGQAIKRLGVVASVLHTGAHPDDEDSGLLAYLARGRQVRTAYLSLTRGDGGQNLIGPELFEALGVIRTDEMLAARRLDGASQFFSRAYDFGFSKSPDEAFKRWDREAVLSDMVRVIRTFRPLVVVSAWTGTPRDGHGHHQASGLLTPEAVRAAADPARFADQIAEGLKPWKARKLYVRAPQQARDEKPEPVTLSINTGEFDPLLGRSYYEIAMEGRSMHRSQDQGALQRRGPHYSQLRLIEPAGAATQQEKDMFDGLDVTLTGIARYAGGAAERLRPSLVEAQQAADEAKQRYSPLTPSSVAPAIARGLGKIREIRASLAGLGLTEAEAYETDFLLKNKESDFQDALAKSGQVVLDCLADDAIVTRGQTFTVTVSAYADATAKAGAIRLALPAGWAAVEQKQTSAVTGGRLAAETAFKVTVASDADYTESYWLKNPRRGDMFSVGKGGTGIEPLSPPAVLASMEFEIAGQKVIVNQKAEYRFADKALGEIRHDLRVAPDISVAITPRFLISPASPAAVEREVTVSLENNLKGGAEGEVSLELPAGWQATPARGGFAFKRDGERASVTFAVKAPPRTAEGGYDLRAIATVQGRQYREGYQAISYPHTQPRFLYSGAETVAKVFDVKVAPGLTVGYVEGAGDDVANALKRLGVNVNVVESRELASGDLSKYDVIMMGIRAYEVRPDVVANNARLLEYVRRGGTLIVQYNKDEYAAGNFAPYPIKMARGMPDRVTDETAAVRLLDPAHPLFNYPNKVTERDFEGWITERGAYFLSEWDPNFKPVMASGDPGDKPQQGGELVADYGSGRYIYTAYAWFRQLPQGVPGAYRLLANLVSYGKVKGAAAPAR